jgi:serine/threonine protein kinase
MSPPGPEPLRALDSEFELGERIGQGAMGSVHRGRQRASGREVALKILHTATASAASRFVREGQITAGLRHPGIVRVHAIGTLHGRPCLAYELVPGARSFEEAIEIDPEQALALLIQAGQALGAAHELGLTHRDVKSENLLVDSTGRLRVTDFGLVTGEELARLTQSGAMVGTPMAMAPEQFGARDLIGPSTDVWALGVLLYRALTGVYPFAGAQDMLSLASAITSGSFERPSRIRPTPRALEAVCLRALSQDPQDRYADGAAFASALESSLEASDPRPWWPWALAGLGALALMAAGAAVVTEPDIPAPPPSASPDPSQVVLQPSPRARETPLPDPLLPLLAWRRGERGPSRPPLALLDEANYQDVSPNFHGMLQGLRAGAGSPAQAGAARALLEGVEVRRDPGAAIELLRCASQGLNRGAQVLLIETLAAEGLGDEELLWIGRLAIQAPRPFELHRLWRIARGQRDRRAEFARRIWLLLDPSEIRWSVLDHLEGRRLSSLEAARAKGPELDEFLVEAALRGWEGDESSDSDWQLGVTLDLLPQATRKRLIERGSPSRRLARLCLRWAGQLQGRPHPDELELLESALRPTLRRADEGWMIQVVEALATSSTSPPCLTEFLGRLELMASGEAQRWAALCRARGFGVPYSSAGVETLRRLHSQGDHEAGLILLSLAGEKSSEVSLRLIGPGVQEGHPASMFRAATRYLKQAGTKGPESAHYQALLRRAADAGYPEAQVLQARLLDLSISKPQDLEEIYAWVEKAAGQDHPDSIRRLALFQEAGFGCQANRGLSDLTLRRGARLGDAKAALAFGQALLRAPTDETRAQAISRHVQARRYLRRARAQGLRKLASLALARHDLADPGFEARGRARLEKLIEQDPTSSAKIDLAKLLLAEGQPQQGEALLRELAGRSFTALHEYLRQLRSTDRGAEAEAFLDQGVRAGRPLALLAAGRERASEALLQRAAKLGRPQALVILGQLLWDSGRPEARRRAWQLWLRAHRAGSESATQHLGDYDWPR